MDDKVVNMKVSDASSFSSSCVKRYCLVLIWYMDPFNWKVEMAPASHICELIYFCNFISISILFNKATEI